MLNVYVTAINIIDDYQPGYCHEETQKIHSKIQIIDLYVNEWMKVLFKLKNKQNFNKQNAGTRKT